MRGGGKLARPPVDSLIQLLLILILSCPPLIRYALKVLPSRRIPNIQRALFDLDLSAPSLSPPLFSLALLALSADTSRCK